MRVWRQLARDGRFVFGAVVLSVLAVAVVFAGVLAPHDPLTMDFEHTLESPSGQYLLGTDEFGRDILSRLIYGGRVSLLVALGSVALAVTIGVSLGIIAGYFEKLGDLLIMRVVEILMALPPIFLAIAVVTLLGQDLLFLVLTLGLLFAPRLARVSYAVTRTVAHANYVEAARVVGCSNLRIIGKAIIPNVLPPTLVQVSYLLAVVILTESGLSFIGLGVTPPDPSWGQMVGTLKEYLRLNPLPVMWPCLAISLTILSVNLMGDSLRDAVDPTYTRWRCKAAKRRRIPKANRQQSTGSI